MIGALNRLFFKQIDASSIAVFRIMFGAILLFESVNYGVFLCLDCMYREPLFLFKYHYFEWAKLPPGIGLELLFVVMGLSSVCVLLGLFYRVAIVILTLSFTYLFLLDQALYLNHFYMVILLCGIMIFIPAHRYWSLDARRKPEIASATLPNWTRFWLGAQLEIILIYAGLVKLNMDWLNLEPMRLWMTEQSRHSHEIFQWLTQDPGIALASYSVIALHLIGAPLLLWKKTRLPVFCLYAVFHCINMFVFNIGIFPWMTLAATLLLFDADWPRQVLACLQRRNKLVSWRHLSKPISIASQGTEKPAALSMITVLIACWLFLQIVVPLRHYAIPGEVAWNEGGHRFSWRMKLRSKRGVAQFKVVTPAGRQTVVDPADYLRYKQVRKMACIPDLIWQFSQFIEAELSTNSEDLKVFVVARCSLNTREPTFLINQLVDLTSIPRNEPLENWVTPLTKELPKRFF